MTVSVLYCSTGGGPGARGPWALLFTELRDVPGLAGPQSGPSVLRRQDFCCDHRGKGSLNSIWESLGASGCRARKPRGRSWPTVTSAWRAWQSTQKVGTLAVTSAQPHWCQHVLKVRKPQGSQVTVPRAWWPAVWVLWVQLP